MKPNPLGLIAALKECRKVIIDLNRVMDKQENKPAFHRNRLSRTN